LTRRRLRSYYSGDPAFENFVAIGPASGAPGPDSVLAALVARLPDPGDVGYLDATFGWWTCWPAVLPSHRDVIAAHLVPQLARGTENDRGSGVVLPLLAEADGPVGPGLTLSLAYGLGAAEQTDRSAAVDALLVLAGRGQLDGPALGTEIGALVTHGALKLTRIVPGLRDVARSGAYADVWATVAAALPGVLPKERATPATGLADFIALGVETAEQVHARGPIPGIAACAGRGGSSRLVAEARRLHRLLTAEGMTEPREVISRLSPEGS
jgi:hypothetical protein